MHHAEGYDINQKWALL